MKNQNYDSNSESEIDFNTTADDRARKRATDSQSSSLGACPYAGDFDQVSVCCAVGTNISNSDKYCLLTKPFKPECTYISWCS